MVRVKPGNDSTYPHAMAPSHGRVGFSWQTESLSPSQTRRSRRTPVTAHKREAGVKRGIVIIVLAAVPVFADDVYLRGGGQITGEIISQTEDSVKVDIGGGGSITARMSSVVRIEKGISPLQDYRERAASIPDGNAEAWRELARWATGNALSSQALKAYSQVVAILPDDQEANRALGRVQLDGKWVTEEESYLARGFVEFEGQWMTPSERQSILADRQALENQARQANEAKIQAIEDEQKAEKERDAAEREMARRQGSVSWGWGYGPGYWPQPRRVW
jgi:hypothetical protein